MTRNIIRLMMVFFLGVVLGGATPEHILEVPCEESSNTVSCFDYDRELLAGQMAEGFVRAISREAGKWFDCGTPTERREWPSRARAMSRALLSALDREGGTWDPWGPWSIVFKETRGNRCLAGPNTREKARRLGLVEKDLPWVQWTEEDILGTLKAPRWGRRLADVGWGHVVWRKYARIRDEKGFLRTPTVEEMIDPVRGWDVLVQALKDRSRSRTSKHLRGLPWYFWPGNVPSYDYVRNLTSILQTMKAPTEGLRRKY